MNPNNNQAATTDYNTALGEFGSVYDPQVQAVQGQEAQALTDKNTALSQLQQDNTTKLAQLDQAKANAFSNNALTANARGINFSGYTPQQNDAYTTNTYNPNVQAQNTNYQRGVDSTNSTYNTNYQTLQDKITTINQQRANDANSLVQNTVQAQQQAAAAAAKAQASAAKTAASNAKAAAPTSAQIATAISSNLAKVTGKDGYVAPEDYAQAYIDWINSGGSSSSFNSNFGRYKNPTNGYYDYAITQAVKRG